MYHECFTDDVQKSRQANAEKILRRAMTQAREEDWKRKFMSSRLRLASIVYLNSLQRRINVNVNEQAYESSQVSCLFPICPRSFAARWVMPNMHPVSKSGAQDLGVIIPPLSPTKLTFRTRLVSSPPERAASHACGQGSRAGLRRRLR